MTDLLKTLLHHYGLLYVTVSQLERERPGNPSESLNAYYETLGPLTPDEPALVVRISPDGETRFLPDDGDEKEPRIGEESGSARVTVWELPEAEFYFFNAFRPGLFDLEKGLPAFLLQIALVYSYKLLENYVGLTKQLTYREVFASESKEDLVQRLIDREVYRLTYESIVSVLEKMRSDLGFRTLTRDYDQAVYQLSLTRNCLLHNAGKVDPKLAAIAPSLDVGENIEVQSSSVSQAINTCRRFCADVDRTFESLPASCAINGQST